MTDWLILLLALTVAITPAIFCPLKLLDGYILPQIGIAAIGMSLAIPLFLVNGIACLGQTQQIACVILLFLMASSAWSTVQHNSVRELPLVFACVAGYIIASTLFVDKIAMVGVTLGIWATGIFTSVYGICQSFRFDPLFPERLQPQTHLYEGKPNIEIPGCFQNKDFVDSRAISTLGNTNFAVGYFIATIPAIVFLTYEVSGWFGLSFIPIFWAIYATKSRAGILSVMCGTFLFLILASREGFLFDWLFLLFGNLDISIVAALCMTILAGGIVTLFWVKDHNPLEALSRLDSEINTTLDIENTDKHHPVAHLRYRGRYCRAAIELILKKPIQGFGLRTYRKEVYGAQARLNMKDRGKFLSEAYQTPQPREVHNDFLENFVEGGIVFGGGFILLLGIIFWNAGDYLKTIDGMQYLCVAGIMAGLVMVMVDACFFFPLRLASSGLTFWVSLALLQGAIGTLIVTDIVISPFAIIMVMILLIAMLWEGSIKPNISSRWFTKHSFTGYYDKKTQYLNKALKYAPKDTIMRTHMFIGNIAILPEEADEQAEVMREHYDGMTPAWIMAFNSGVARAALKDWGSAAKFFRESLFYLPSFMQAREEYAKVDKLAPLRRMFLMKVLTPEGQSALGELKTRIDKSKTEIQLIESSMMNIVLTEKVKLGIPHNWAYDGTRNIFVAPNELPENSMIVEIGPARIPVLQYKQEGQQ